MSRKSFILAFVLSILLFDFNHLFAQYQENATQPGLIPYRKGNKWGYCDRNKKIIIPIQYDEAWLFFHGVAHVSLNGKSGFVNTKGIEVVPLIFDIVDPKIS